MSQYLDLPGLDNHRAFAPHAADMSITGDIAFAVKVAMDDWTPADGDIGFMSKGSIATYVFLFSIGSDGTLKLHFAHSGGSQFGKSSTATGVTDGETKWVGGERDQSAGEVKYYTSDDGTNWSQLGTTQTGITTNNIDTNTRDLAAGAIGISDSLAGKLYEAKLISGLLETGTVIAHFNADDFSVGDSDTDTASGVEGNTWTIDGAGSEIKSDTTSAASLLLLGAG